MERVQNEGRPDMDIPAYRTDMITVAGVGDQPYSNLEEALSFLYPEREIIKAFDPIRVCNCSETEEKREINIPI